jgi:molybdenum cofactor cytidylyltransferase
LGPDRLGVFVFLGDMPHIPIDVLALLADAVSAGASAAAPTFRGEMGHPVVIGAPLFPRLNALKGDRGARGLLEQLGPHLARIPCSDPGVLFDVDTRDALDRA